MHVKRIKVNLIFGAQLSDYTALFSSAHFKEKVLKAEKTKSRGRRTKG